MLSSVSRPEQEARATAGADLRGADLRGADLRGRDLRGIRLGAADLSGALLDGADLTGATLADAELVGASCASTRFVGADLRRTRAGRADFSGADLSGARIDGAEWRHVRAAGAVWQGATGRGVRLDRADLSGVDLRRVVLPAVVLDGAVVEAADFADAQLPGAGLAAVTGNANWRGAELFRADLRDTDVRSVLLTGGRIAGARLPYAFALAHPDELRAAGWAPRGWQRWRIGVEVRRRARVVALASRREEAARRAARQAAEKQASRASARPGVEKPAPERRPEAVPVRRAVEQRARAELRARARRRALAARARAARGLERISTLGSVVASGARSWRDAVLGQAEEGDPIEAVDAGMQFPIEATIRAEAFEFDRATLDNRTRAVARMARIEESVARNQAAALRAREARLAEARSRRAEALIRQQLAEPRRVAPPTVPSAPVPRAPVAPALPRETRRTPPAPSPARWRLPAFPSLRDLPPFLEPAEAEQWRIVSESARSAVDRASVRIASAGRVVRSGGVRAAGGLATLFDALLAVAVLATLGAGAAVRLGVAGFAAAGRGFAGVGATVGALVSRAGGVAGARVVAFTGDVVDWVGGRVRATGGALSRGVARSSALAWSGVRWGARTTASAGRFAVSAGRTGALASVRQAAVARAAIAFGFVLVWRAFRKGGQVAGGGVGGAAALAGRLLWGAGRYSAAAVGRGVVWSVGILFSGLAFVAGAGVRWVDATGERVSAATARSQRWASDAWASARSPSLLVQSIRFGSFDAWSLLRLRVEPIFRVIVGPADGTPQIASVDDAAKFRLEAANRERDHATDGLLADVRHRRTVRVLRTAEERVRRTEADRIAEVERERAARRAELARLEAEASRRGHDQDWLDRVQADLASRRTELARLDAEAAPNPAAEPSRGLDLAKVGSRVLENVRRLSGIAQLFGAESLRLGPGVDLRDRQLDDRNLAGLDLTGAILAGAGLVGSDLRGTRLHGADLRGADLTAARLQGASLDGAQLEDADFTDADLTGVTFTDASVARARFRTARGIDPGLREDLARRGADLGLAEDGRWVRVSGWAMAMSIFLAIGLYLGLRLSQKEELDAAALEHAASLAQQQGDPQAAAGRFEELARNAKSDEAKVGYLLEAAAAAAEAGNFSASLGFLEEARVAGAETVLMGRVLLRHAQVQHDAGLLDAAAEGFRAVLKRADLSPTDQAHALLGLAAALPADQEAEIGGIEGALLAAAATDPQRSALGMALADGWAGQGRLDLANAAMERALALVTSVSDEVPMRMRLARLRADEGDADGALAIYRAVVALPDGAGAEARLGAAELLARRGAEAEADAMLAVLRASDDADLRVRAELATATIAGRRGDDDSAVKAFRRVLDTDGVEPRLHEEARLGLARILVRSDPTAAAALAESTPDLKDEIRLGQARALREAGKRADARAIWVAIVDDPLGGRDARLESQLALAELEVEEGEVDAAMRRYEALMSDTSSIPVRQRVQLGAAQALVLAGRLQEAEARYTALEATARGEVADQCQLGLGRCAELRGQTEKAAQLYQALGSREGPWAVEALYALGQMRESQGDPAGAASAYRLARGRPGADATRKADVEIALARSLQDAGDPGAAAVYAQLLDATDPVVRVQARIAVAERTLGEDPARARTLFEEALAESEAGESRAQARGGWLRASVALGDVQNGLDRIGAWLETETDDALRGELAVAAVEALRSEGRYDEAIAIGERYADVGGFELGMALGSGLRESGRASEAAALFAGLTPGTPEDAQWHTETYADTLLEAGRLEEAARLYAALAELPGGASAAGLGAARIARERGQFEEALALLGSNEDPRAPAERATVLEGLGRWEEAEITWGRLALAPDLDTRSAGVTGMARARLNHDDPTGAIAVLDTVGRVAEGYRLTATQIRGEALLALGRVDEARALYTSLGGDAESRTVAALGLGETALGGDDPEAAGKHFDAAYSGTLDGYYRAFALAGLVRARAEAGDTGGAQEVLARLRTEHPDRIEAIEMAASAVP